MRSGVADPSRRDDRAGRRLLRSPCPPRRSAAPAHRAREGRRAHRAWLLRDEARARCSRCSPSRRKPSRSPPDRQSWSRSSTARASPWRSWIRAARALSRVGRGAVPARVDREGRRVPAAARARPVRGHRAGHRRDAHEPARVCVIAEGPLAMAAALAARDDARARRRARGRGAFGRGRGWLVASLTASRAARVLPAGARGRLRQRSDRPHRVAAAFAARCASPTAVDGTRVRALPRRREGGERLTSWLADEWTSRPATPRSRPR